MSQAVTLEAALAAVTSGRRSERAPNSRRTKRELPELSQEVGRRSGWRIHGKAGLRAEDLEPLNKYWRNRISYTSEEEEDSDLLNIPESVERERINKGRQIAKEIVPAVSPGACVDDNGTEKQSIDPPQVKNEKQDEQAQETEVVDQTLKRNAEDKSKNSFASRSKARFSMPNLYRRRRSSAASETVEAEPLFRRRRPSISKKDSQDNESGMRSNDAVLKDACIQTDASLLPDEEEIEIVKQEMEETDPVQIPEKGEISRPININDSSVGHERARDASDKGSNAATAKYAELHSAQETTAKLEPIGNRLSGRMEFESMVEADSESSDENSDSDITSNHQKQSSSNVEHMSTDLVEAAISTKRKPEEKTSERSPSLEVRRDSESRNNRRFTLGGAKLVDFTIHALTDSVEHREQPLVEEVSYEETDDYEEEGEGYEEVEMRSIAIQADVDSDLEEGNSSYSSIGKQQDESETRNHDANGSDHFREEDEGSPKVFSPSRTNNEPDEGEGDVEEGRNLQDQFSLSLGLTETEGFDPLVVSESEAMPAESEAMPAESEAMPAEISRGRFSFDPPPEEPMVAGDTSARDFTLENLASENVDEFLKLPSNASMPSFSMDTILMEVRQERRAKSNAKKPVNRELRHLPRLSEWSVDENETRRSDRVRFKPLKYWMNETVVYGRKNDWSMPAVVGLMKSEEISPEETTISKKRKVPARHRNPSKQPPTKSIAKKQAPRRATGRSNQKRDTDARKGSAKTKPDVRADQSPDVATEKRKTQRSAKKAEEPERNSREQKADQVARQQRRPRRAPVQEESEKDEQAEENREVQPRRNVRNEVTDSEPDDAQEFARESRRADLAARKQTQKGPTKSKPGPTAKPKISRSKANPPRRHSLNSVETEEEDDPIYTVPEGASENANASADLILVEEVEETDSPSAAPKRRRRVSEHFRHSDEPRAVQGKAKNNSNDDKNARGGVNRPTYVVGKQKKRNSPVGTGTPKNGKVARPGKSSKAGRYSPSADAEKMWLEESMLNGYDKENTAQTAQAPKAQASAAQGQKKRRKLGAIPESVRKEIDRLRFGGIAAL